MKNIKKTLIASVLACSALNAQAEVSPFDYGIKARATWSSAISVNSEAKFNSAKGNADPKITRPFFTNFWGAVTGYYGYAFHEYNIGVEVGAGYGKFGYTLEGSLEKTAGKEEDEKDTELFVAAAPHGIYIPATFYWYPLGREEDEGMLKLGVGGFAFIPVTKSDIKRGEKWESAASKDEGKTPGYDLGFHFSAEYEFSNGVSFGAEWDLGMRNRIRGVEGEKGSTDLFANIEKLNKVKSQILMVGAGWNIARLFQGE